MVKSALCAAIAAAALMLCLFFFGTAIFVWASGVYGTLITCIAFGVFFLVVAAIASATLLILRHKAAERQRATAKAHPWWLDPRVVSAGLELSKTVGGRRALSLGVVGAFIVGLLLSRAADKK